MRTIKFDNYKVNIKTIETNSNYDLSVQIFRGKEKSTIGGTILKRGTKDIDILKFAIKNIETEVNLF